MQQVVRKALLESNKIEPIKKNYTLLVDGNSLLKSSLVNKSYANENGEVYGGIYTFLYRVGYILSMRDFNRCIVCWDGSNSGSLRWKIYSDYKSNRGKNYSSYDSYIARYTKKVLSKNGDESNGDDDYFLFQMRILQSILEELFVRQYMFDDVEGDDLIAYCCNHISENEYIVIVSEDRDLCQLISERVCVYIPSKKTSVSQKNDVKVLGVPYYNIVLRKIICGDKSDNIKGVKGMGEKTLELYYPQIKEMECSLNGFLDNCKLVLEGRASEHKKPIQCLENAINRVTDGCQGKDLYEINKSIIDLSNPLLTEEAKNKLDESYYLPIDPCDRNVNNVYKILSDNKFERMMDSKTFGNLFGPYERIKMKEMEFFEKSC